jgi:hypothetical protein
LSARIPCEATEGRLANFRKSGGDQILTLQRLIYSAEHPVNWAEPAGPRASGFTVGQGSRLGGDDVTGRSPETSSAADSSSQSVRRLLIIMMAAGPTMTTNTPGKMKITSGKIILTEVCCAFSSAICIRLTRIMSD